MAVSATIIAQEALTPVAGTPIDCAFPLFAATDCVVLMGVGGAVAVKDTDFTVALNETDFSDFTVTPTASLRTKLDAIVAGSVDEEDKIVIRRSMALTSSMTPTLARLRQQISLEFDRTMLRLQEVNAKVDGAVRVPDAEIGGTAVVLPPIPTRATKVAAFDASGQLTVSTATLAVIEAPGVAVTDAQAAATAAAASAVAAAASAVEAATFNPANYLLSANDLSDLNDAPTALANIGAQAQDDDLDAIAALTPTNGDVITRAGGAWTAAAPVQGFQTGDVIFSMRRVVDIQSGWIALDGSTIGDTGSGADYEGPEYEALFNYGKYAWGNAGTEDFALGHTILTPDTRGVGPIGINTSDLANGESGSFSTRALGATGGEEAHALSGAEGPSHLHTYNAPTTAVANYDPPAGAPETAVPGIVASNTGLTGSGTAHNNMQPFLAFVMIAKL